MKMWMILKGQKKTFTKLLFEEDYRSYNEALLTLGLCSLQDRKKAMTLRFAKQSLADGHFANLFPKRRFQLEIEKRQKEEFQVFWAHTSRYQNSPILTMQRLLNTEEQQLIYRVTYSHAVWFFNCMTLSPEYTFSCICLVYGLRS